MVPTQIIILILKHARKRGSTWSETGVYASVPLGLRTDIMKSVSHTRTVHQLDVIENSLLVQMMSSMR